MTLYDFLFLEIIYFLNLKSKIEEKKFNFLEIIRGIINYDTFTKKKPFCSESFIKKNK